MLDRQEVNASQDNVSRASVPTPPPERDMFTEADNSANADESNKFFQDRANMLAQQKVGGEGGGGKDDKGMVKLNPMSQLQASSTVVNLLLATGPFS